MLLETIILPALVPAAIDLVKKSAERLIGVKAQTVEEVLKLKEAENERLRTIAALDNPGGTPAQWVVNLRGSYRYIAGSFFLVNAIVIGYVPDIAPEIIDLSWQAAGAVFSFLFGENLYARFKNKE